MGNITVERVMQLWNTWDDRFFMLTSLLIQALLTILAPYRKRCASRILKFCLWLLYLSADAVALFTIGLITSSQGVDSPQRQDLLAFWAPFLLLHLGGPDTITALALEDNELWHRHALQLAIQLVVTLYVFVQSLRGDNRLWMPTVLMYVDGCIKYTERTEALYFASMNSFRESLASKPESGPDYARFKEEEHCCNGSSHVSIDIQDRSKDNKLEGIDHQNDLKNYIRNEVSFNTWEARIDAYAEEEEDGMIKDAYKFYMKFKGLLADAFLSLEDREESRSFFLDKAASKVYRVIEIELNFVYDIFYTKVFLLQKKQAYVRIVSFLSVVASLLLFVFENKNHYHETDIGITFALLGGAIALDVYVVIMLMVSDWWVITTPKVGLPKHMRSYMMRFLKLLRCTKGHSRFRWAESISRYNLLDRCFKSPPSFLKFIIIKRIRDALMGILYVETKKVDEQLVVNFIIEELQKKAKLATDIKASKEVYSARGNLVLENDYFLVSKYLNPWTLDVEYDESVLIWHLATDICYWTADDNVRGTNYPNFCKQVSDYMTYLLLRQKSLVSLVVGMSEIRFEDTCEEAKKVMNRNVDSGWFTRICAGAKKFVTKKLMCQISSVEGQNTCPKKDELIFQEFCNKVLKMQAEVLPMTANKCEKSKSVLLDACLLAKQLKTFGDIQWEITSKVWVELLCYAATRCSPKSHVAQLSKGGELITLVWLLMAHLGLGERFLQNQGFGWTKLIIHK
ncbi:uncharacterized protein LOC110723076 [Chenopodium quinoa]|uniref:uncharacterized protein LOC110723076 n=1 Tax=Chenopodium quinoa TaxID=63459 RepID=UPI000B7912D9|nr:uncharacterized protein LOC110723076 [Chenopodium quinoa]